MIETSMFSIFLFWLAVIIPLIVTDGMFVTRLRERYPEAWEDLGRPGFLVDPRTSHKIRGFLRHGGDHPMMQDPYIRRIADSQFILVPVQKLLFVVFVGLFVWRLVS